MTFFCFRLICYALFLIFIMLLCCFFSFVFSFFPVLRPLLPTVELTLGIYVNFLLVLFLKILAYTNSFLN